MKATILIADDDFDNRTIAKEALEAHGYRIVLAENGLEALELAAREYPDLILLDLSMPKLSGWETAKRLRQLPNFSSIPIVAFTAHALLGDDVKAKISGCNDCLTKPCLPKEIVQKIEFWLNRQKNVNGDY